MANDNTRHLAGPLGGLAACFCRNCAPRGSALRRAGLRLARRKVRRSEKKDIEGQLES